MTVPPRAGAAAPTPVAPPAAADARRLTGPNLFAAEPGAVLDATWRAADLPDAAARDALAARWAAGVRAAAAAAGWPAPAVHTRTAGDATTAVLTLFASAPVDALDAAVDAAERAWQAAVAGVPMADEAVAAVRAAAAATANPRLPAFLAAAEAHAHVATWDDDATSVGVGQGSREWPTAELPEADAVDWAAVRDAPVALVTGANGKTTTTRLTAAILRAAGHTVATTTTDGVRVDGPDGAGEALEAGDWAGPGGARLALRHPRVTAAVLETARGGMLRRGLALRRATAAAVTNIAEDHFGDFGIFDLEALADAKLVVARALEATGGPLVLAADDPTLRGRATSLQAAPFPLVWTATDLADAAAHALVDAHAAAGGRACVVAVGKGGEEALRWFDSAAWHDVVPTAEVAIAAGGAARYNLANAATATALSLALGATLDAVRTTLRAFGAAPGDNPGRLELLPVGDVTALVDYAHNPAGLAALLDAAARVAAAGRRLLVLGQAGDRDDAALAELARAAWRPGVVDRVQLKALPEMARGRPPAEVPALLRAALAAAGAPGDLVAPEVAADESEAARLALAWARPGDLLVLPLHTERAAVVRWLRTLNAEGWRAGIPVPPPSKFTHPADP